MDTTVGPVAVKGRIYRCGARRILITATSRSDGWATYRVVGRRGRRLRGPLGQVAIRTSLRGGRLSASFVEEEG